MWGRWGWVRLIPKGLKIHQLHPFCGKQGYKMSFIYLWEFCISHRLVVYCDSNVFSTRRVYKKTVMFHCQHSAHCSSIHSHVCLRAGCKLKERLSIQARHKQHQRRFGPNADHRSSPMFCCGKLERGRHWLKRHYPNGLCENA